MFCTTDFLVSYGESVLDNYFKSCFNSKNNFNDFIKVFSSNYADLNTLHPFREGNGRTQREFARLICLKCGYIFDLSCTTHEEMLEASILSFNNADNSKLEAIFSKAIIPIGEYKQIDDKIKILSLDDLVITIQENINNYLYYKEDNIDLINKYNSYYEEKLKNKKIENK